jgi:FkbM family methyltransferase
VPEEPQRSPARRALRRPARFDRPHYLLDPIGTVRRRVARTPGRTKLPWGLPFAYGPTGPMGKTLERSGVYDLAITETVFRLLQPGDAAIDVGANAGYMTSIMAVRVGRDGHVSSFEPQPDVFERLAANVDSWQRAGVEVAPVELHNMALSDQAGPRAMNIPIDSDANHERASLRNFEVAHTTIEVEVERLDELPAPAAAIALLKLDAEHHELEIMRGGERLLASVATVIVEEHDEPPTGVTQLLLEHGFTLFTVHESLTGPRLHPLQTGVPHVGWGPPNVIATRLPDELRASFARRGWTALARHHRRR